MIIDLSINRRLMMTTRTQMPNRNRQSTFVQWLPSSIKLKIWEKKTSSGDISPSSSQFYFWAICVNDPLKIWKLIRLSEGNDLNPFWNSFRQAWKRNGNSSFFNWGKSFWNEMTVWFWQQQEKLLLRLWNVVWDWSSQSVENDIICSINSSTPKMFRNTFVGLLVQTGQLSNYRNVINILHFNLREHQSKWFSVRSSTAYKIHTTTCFFFLVLLLLVL